MHCVIVNHADVSCMDPSGDISAPTSAKHNFLFKMLCTQLPRLAVGMPWWDRNIAPSQTQTCCAQHSACSLLTKHYGMQGSTWQQMQTGHVSRQHGRVLCYVDQQDLQSVPGA